MQIFIKDLDYEYAKLSPMETLFQLQRTQNCNKAISDFSKEETEKIAKNYGVLKMLFCGLGSNEFNCVSTCDTAEEVWDILETTYEGTSQVQKSKISLYVN